MKTDSAYSILSTLRYDPKLAQVASDQYYEDDGIQMEFSTPTETLFLDKQDKGYVASNTEWENFSEFQKEFDQANFSVTSSSTAFFKSLLDCSYSDNLKRGGLKDLMFYRFLFLRQHVTRINLARDYFHWNVSTLSISKLLELLILSLQETVGDLQQLISDVRPYKMRVLISASGDIRVEAHPLPILDLSSSSTASEYFINTLLKGMLPDDSTEPYTAFIDTKPIPNNTPFTTFKTTQREHYTQARERMIQIESNAQKREIIVYNELDEVMEGSITNIAVYRNGTFVTPPLSTGCLCGVFRYYLLKKNLINVANISAQELKKGETVLLFNGVMGCVKGIIAK
ncbi:aminodeoxychorismate lyase ABZ2 KNAG_0D02760 [Huiozyma naganishii CBS 8797]|uniref:Aminodeoxychorismate lyase n=1 Tax=Huiozyma naganishii (strain ATCC MYA-139 / BCRC 22969 / CBS 8797 / KCTC 17520 / NBRC 10181 / NCYC 3082 / Yp74L-3) TaxID=1071383 RepID=J7R5B3_HUIN7|nr:hypothetical protein KNAG_0D02760 [Kazachstania naganishii CBS 8797]CCK70025.1 hypothetical protein KNAG_0D02760 [Kazachstania naganishii CBS 8797]